MKKTFSLKFLVLSALLMVGNVFAFAQSLDPKEGQAVGTTLAGNVVTYRVNSTTYVEVENSEGVKEKTYPVTITGLDADGLDALKGTSPTINLEIPVTFREKIGEKYYRFYVTKIDKGLDGTTPQSFYGYTEIKSLKFVPVKTGENSNAAYYGLDKFTYSVGDLAFYGCTGMRTLEFTENCKTIGKYAFQNTSIRSFVIPKQCETIDEYAFYNCGFINTVTVAEGNTAMHTLGTHVFGNSSLEVLDLRNATKLYEIKGQPFMYELSSVNDVLKRVMLPASVKAINEAFANCTALTGFGLAEDAEGYNADNNPGDLDKTSLGASDGQGIINGAFAGCRSLTLLNFPNCNIAGAPFAGCTSLAKITFVAKYDKVIGSTTYIKNMDNLFGNCDVNDADYEAKYKKTQEALKTIEFKGAFRGTIADNAFVGVKGLETVDFKGGLQYGATINASFTDVETLTAVNFTSEGHATGIDTWNQLTNASKDDKDITIKAGAFQNTGISTLNFGNIVSGYTKVATILIEGDAFTGNKNLKSVTIGTTNFATNGTVQIADNAFADGNVALATVTIGEITTARGNSGSFLIGSASADAVYTKTEDDFPSTTGKIYYELVSGEYVVVESPADANKDKYYEKTSDAVVGSRVFGDGEHLTTVTIADKVNDVAKVVRASNFNIGKNAFASTGLTTVTFGNIQAVQTKNSTFTVEENAFVGGDTNAKTVTIGTIADNATGQLTATIGETAFAADKLQTVTIGNMEATKVDIKEAAFQGKSLETVTLGNITASANASSTFDAAENAFQGGEVNAKTVKIGEIKDYKSGSTTHDLTATIGKNAFAADKLTTVTIAIKADNSKGSIAAKKVEIGESAFEGKSLQTVTLGNISALTAASTFDVKEKAFYGGDTEDKTVEIGTITDNSTTNTLTATIGDNAFAADALKSVKIDHMTATSLTIGNKAFAGKKLDTVDLGNMTATTLNITGANAFANENKEDVMTESITIGEIGDGLNISGTTVFNGPAKAGSTLNVTIAKFAGAATIPAGTFFAPVEGTASYTVTGDVVASALTKVEAGAFTGSQVWEKGAPVDNNTLVWFKGDYNDEFPKVGTFTNVSNLIIAVAGSLDDENQPALTEAKSYNVEGRLGRFAGVKTVTIGNIPAAKFVAANNSPESDNIEEVTFFGSVEGAIKTFTSKIIRKIDFKNVKQAKVLVVEGAVEEKAFQAAAADAAAKGENITVRYYEGYDGQTREAKQIFNKKAFGTAKTDAQSVTLYTTPWAKANVFEAADVIDGEKMAVYRLAYSDSEVAPGDAIEAAVYKKEGNTYAYGKLYVPAGINMKYKVNAEYNATEKKNAVQLYYGRIDNSNNEISMYNLPVIDGYYWIDATEVDQVFVVRTNTELKSEMKVEAEPVTAEEDAIIVADITGDYYYWDAALAVQNQLRFATQDIIHSELMNNAEFKDRNVYYMANPVKHGFGFILFDKTAKYTKATGDYEIGDYKPLVKNSLYVVGKENTNARMLTIVFADEETNTTGIETVETAEQNSDAIYNLNGVRVNGAQKGIYIKNGKKYIVK